MIGVVLAGDVTANTIESVAHGLVANDPVMFAPYGPTLPGGLAGGTIYYVIASGLTTDAFKVSATLGGSAVDITSEGAFYVLPTAATVAHPAGSICVSPEVGTLTLDPATVPISLNTPAWGIPDLSQLITVLEMRGSENVTLPEEQGRRAYTLVLDQIQVALPFLVSGVCDQTGAAYADEEIGLTTNLLYLRANVFRPTTATRGSSLSLATGGTLTGPIQSASGLQPVKKARGYMSGVWTINVPLGELV